MRSSCPGIFCSNERIVLLHMCLSVPVLSREKVKYSINVVYLASQWLPSAPRMILFMNHGDDELFLQDVYFNAVNDL